jgi:hypothetical protein
MKRKPPDSRNALSALRLSLALSLVTLIPLLLYGSAPSWWSDRGVLIEQGVADDYAPANQGQLKNIAKAAVTEMDAKLSGGAGETLHQLIASWSNPNSQTNDFAPLNLGQLKNVAKSFYDRLISIGLATEYPWTNSPNASDDFAVANIGQVKKLFSFELPAIDPLYDGDHNGLPDAWERQYFGQTGVDPNGDPDGDGTSTLQEYLNHTDPTDFFNGMLSGLAITGGGDQRGNPGTLLPLPVSVRVSSLYYNGVDNAPVTVMVTQGGARLVSNNSNSNEPSDSLTLRANAYDAGGYSVAQFYILLASSPDVSIIRASTHGGSKSLSVSTSAVAIDTSLGVPTNVTVTATSTSSAMLTWTAAPNALPTTLQASVDDGKTWITLGTVAAGRTSATVTGLRAGQKTKFRLFSGGMPSDSNNSSFSLPDLSSGPPPQPPQSGGGGASDSAGVVPLAAPVLEVDQAAFYYGIGGGYGGMLNQRTLYKRKEIVIKSDFRDMDGNQITAGSTTQTFTWIPGHESFGRGGHEVTSTIVTGDGAELWIPYDTAILTDSVMKLVSSGLLFGSTSSKTVTLSEPYTEADAEAAIAAATLQFYGEFYKPYQIFDAFLGRSGIVVTKYRFKVNADPNAVVTWDVQFTPELGGPVQHDFQSWHGDGSSYTPTYLLDPRVLNGGQHGSYKLVLLRAELMVDGNRDGEMSFDDTSIHEKDGTTAEKPYQFWVNNDMDGDEQDFAPSPADYVLNTLMNRRGLEDFTRLWINLKGLTQMVKTGGVQLQLDWKPAGAGDDWSSGDHPGIKIFKASEANGGRRYVEEDAVADQQLALPYRLALLEVGRDTGKVTLPLSTETLTALSEDAPNLYFIFEGVSAGKGRLVLNLIKNGEKIGEFPPLCLDIRDIKNMYERWSVDPVADVPATGAEPLQTAAISTRDLPTGQSTGFTYNAQGPERKTYIIFAHGWNLAPSDKDNFAETSYKRLWWQGYTGRFAAFQWPTTWGFDGIGDITRPRGFDEGEFIAWRSAPALTGLLDRLNGQCPGQVYVMAHSQGNVVAGEALRLLGRNGKSINTYAACQAAVAAEVYNPGAVATFPLSFPFGTGPSTPDIYPNWLTPNGAGVVRKENFFNLNDWALNTAIWELDQELKPDISIFGSSYGWYSGAGDDRFWRASPLDTTYIHLGDQSNPRDRYEIMSFAAEARSRALGRVSGNVSGFNSTHDMPADELWGVDPHHNEFRDRPWHSGEFNFSNMQVRNFWDQLLRTYRLKTPQ